MEVYSTIGKTTAPEFYSKDPLRSQKDSLMSVALQDTSLTQVQRDSIQVVYGDTTVKADSLLTEQEF